MAASQDTVPANLLKNFDPYTVLEPVRTNPVEKLIDIDDPSTSSNTLLLPKVKNLDLIDVFQDIFVTPELVQRNNTPIEEFKENTSLFTVPKDDLDQFFDDLESGKKIDWTEVDKIDVYTKNDDLCTPDHKPKELTPKINFDLAEKPKELTPKINFKKKTQYEDPEDLIQEVLTQKHIEKQFLERNKTPIKNVTEKSITVQNKQDGHDNKTKIQNRVIDYNEIEQHTHELHLNHGVIKKITAPNLNFSAKNGIKSTTNSNLNSNTLLNCNRNEVRRNFTKDVNKTTAHFEPKISEAKKHSYIDNAIQVHLKELNNEHNLCIQQDFKKLLGSTSKYTVDDLKLPPYNMEDGFFNNGDYNSFTNFTLKTIKKDEKLYRKKKISIPDCYKKNYTKGASFAEKSGFLTQFLARIATDQQCLDEMSQLKNRLVYDSPLNFINIDKKIKENNILFANINKNSQNGIKVREYGIPNPVVLKENHNRDVLKAHLQDQKILKFLNGK